MAVPAVAAIRKEHPNAEIIWAIDPRCQAVVDDQRLVSSLYPIPRDQWKKDGVSPLAQMRHYAKLRTYGFDYGIDLQGRSKTAICLRLARPKKRMAVESIELGSWALNRAAHCKAVHCVERNLEAVREIGLVSGESEPEFLMPDLSVRISALSSKFQVKRELVSIHVGAGATWKRWPLESWLSLAHALSDEYQIALIGGPSDEKPPTGPWIDLVGQLSLEDSMAVVAMSRLHCAADTGSGHMAAAYNVPLVSLFGSTNPERYRPYSSRTRVIKAPNMSLISPGQVLAEVQLALS